MWIKKQSTQILRTKQTQNKEQTEAEVNKMIKIEAKAKERASAGGR